MALFVDEVEAGLLVDLAGGVEIALGPERDLQVAGFAGELDALVDEHRAEAGAAGAGFDQEKAEFGGSGLVRVLDEEDVADGLVVSFGDPATVAGGVVVDEEVSGDLRDQGLEVVVVTVLFGIDGGLTVDDPADVAGVVGAEGYGLRGHG